MAGLRDIYGCDYFVAQAKQLGASDAEIAAFKAANTNADGSWDCNRMLEAFGGQREVDLGQYTPAQVAAAAALPPPVIAPATTSGDARMFLSLSNVPDAVGSAAPARSSAAFASSPIGTGLFGGLGGSSATGGGLNMMTLLLLALMAGAAWYLFKGK